MELFISLTFFWLNVCGNIYKEFSSLNLTNFVYRWPEYITVSRYRNENNPQWNWTLVSRCLKCKIFSPPLGKIGRGNWAWSQVVSRRRVTPQSNTMADYEKNLRDTCMHIYISHEVFLEVILRHVPAHHDIADMLTRRSILLMSVLFCSIVSLA